MSSSNSDDWRKKVNPKLPLLINHLNPQQILPYLPTLTSVDKQEVICRQQNYGKSIAAQCLLDNLERRPRGYRELMNALMQPEIDLITVALEIDKEFAENGALSPEKTQPDPPVVQHYHQYGDNSVMTVNPVEPSLIESGPKESQASLNENEENALKNIDYSISCDSTKQITVEGSDTFDETSAKSVKLSNPQEVAEGEESEDPMVTAVKESSLHTAPSSTDNHLDKVLAPVPPSVSLGTLPPSRALDTIDLDTLPPSRALDTTDLHKEVSQSGVEADNISGVALLSSEKENNSKTTEPVQNKETSASSVGSDDTAADSETNTSSGSSICGSTESSGPIIINGCTIINKRKKPGVPKDLTAGEIKSTEGSEGGFTGEDDGLQAVGDQKVDRVKTMTARPMGKNRLEENVKFAPVSTADIDSLQDCINPPPQQNLSKDDKGIIVVNESVKVDDIGVDNDLVAIPTENHGLKLQAHGNLLVQEEQSDEVTESRNGQAPTILVTSPTDESTYISSDTQEDGMPLHSKLERENFSLERYPEEEENESKNVINDVLIEKPFSSEGGHKDVDHTHLDNTKVPPGGDHTQLDITKATPGGEPKGGYMQYQYLIFGGAVILGFYAVWKYTKKSTINYF